MMTHSSDEADVIRVGSVGLGGYARSILDLIRRSQKDPQTGMILTGVFEPDLSAHAQFVAELRAAGVSVFDRLEPLLESGIDAVCLPVPIDLHRRYCQQCLQAGVHVLCEKPAAGCVQDCDAMIEARDRAGRVAIIGFQDLYDPTILDAKRAILADEIGRPKYVTFRACWPRNSEYFGRNGWAGRFKRDGVWVMDSPAMNAMSHFLHLSLFMVGPGQSHAATPVEVTAELYRANPIENYDTCAIRTQTLEGVPLLVLMTHASGVSVDPMLVIKGEHGMVEITFGQVIVRNRQGTRTVPRNGEIRGWMLRTFADLIRGRTPETAVATLEMARRHLVVVNAASEACPVYDIPPQFVQTIAAREKPATLRAVPGIDTLLRECAHENVMPHDSGKAAWTRQGQSIDVRDYRFFKGPATRAV